jgi:hypothetical protein
LELTEVSADASARERRPAVALRPANKSAVAMRVATKSAVAFAKAKAKEEGGF